MQNADYLVVIELLGHPDGRPRDLLGRALDLDQDTLGAALASLERDGVVVTTDGHVRPSDAMRRLDSLNLIAV